jgi:DNA polymerase-3 subunit delta'
MPITPLFGHQEVRERLSAAIGAGSLPQVILLTGPAGVGKQRLGLWLAARLLCERGADEPCGECGRCRRVGELAHPDVHWLVPVPRPKAAEPDKQVEEVTEALEVVMAERRQGGRWQAPDGMAIHGIASARWLQRHAAMTAAEGSWRVFVIGRAERLVPQESSADAANALLKLLEEPPPRSVFVLTASEPGLVLPTIRSRAVPVRVGRISDEDVARFASTQGIDADVESVRQAGGSIGRLLSGEDAARRKAFAAAKAVRTAVTEDAGARALLALRQPLAQARGEFTAMLDALVELYQAELRAATGRTGQQRTARRALRAIDLVLATREQAQGNVNPRLALGALTGELAVMEQG